METIKLVAGARTVSYESNSGETATIKVTHAGEMATFVFPQLGDDYQYVAESCSACIKPDFQIAKLGTVMLPGTILARFTNCRDIGKETVESLPDGLKELGIVGCPNIAKETIADMLGSGRIRCLTLTNGTRQIVCSLKHSREIQVVTRFYEERFTFVCPRPDNLLDVAEVLTMCIEEGRTIASLGTLVLPRACLIEYSDCHSIDDSVVEFLPRDVNTVRFSKCLNITDAIMVNMYVPRVEFKHCNGLTDGVAKLCKAPVKYVSIDQCGTVTQAIVHAA